ncbi:unnamed protein product, partial [Rotaria sp. Silwood2]
MEKIFESAPLHSPSNICIHSINGTSARIRWNALDPLDQGGFITNYKIMYFSLSSPQTIHAIGYSNNQSSMTSYMLTNLD